MSGFSERVRSVEHSATVRISDVASELEAEGSDVIDLTAGDPDFPTPDHVVEAAHDALDRGETHYTPADGLPELRDAIADKLRTENGLDVGRDDVVVTPGGKQALFESILALVEEGDEVVIPTPAWVSYESIVRLAGGTPRPVELNPETGFTLDGVDLSAVVSDDTRAFLLNTPSNPTGAVFSADQLARVRDLAVEHDFWVVADEIYERTTYDANHHSIASFDGMAERTVTVNGFSKAYAMTGWRLGYYTGPDALLDAARKVHAHSVTCATTFAQRGAIAALTGPQGPVEAMRATFRERRDAVVAELRDRGVSLPTPDGAFYVFVPVANRDDVALCEEMLSEVGVAAVPGTAFGTPGYARLSYTSDRGELLEAIDRMEPYLATAE